jgi:hypothetical protein
MFGWPSAVTSVGNLAYGELGPDYAMGAVLPNLWEGRYGTWALHLREWTPSLGQGDNWNSNPDPNSNSNQAFDLMWGRKFGTTSLGLQLNRSFNGLTDEIPGTTWTWSQDGALNDFAGYSGRDPRLARNILGVGAGLGFEINAKTTADVSILYQARSFEQSQSGTGGGSYTDDGGSNYLIGFRANHKCTPTMVMVPVIKLYSFDLSSKTKGVTTTDKNTVSGWQVGAAGNWTIGTNDLLILGATIAQNSLDQESDVLGYAYDLNNTYDGGGFDFNPKLKATESVTPEIFMALETQVNPWLTLRMGATKAVFHTTKVEGTTGTVNETVTIKDSPFSMNAGASIKLGTLTFDTVLNSNFFQQPFAQLLGNSYATGYPVFPKVTATYRW